MSEQTVSDLHPGPYGLFVPPHQVSEPASSAVPEDAAAAPAGPVLATVFCPGGKFTKVGWGTFVGLFTRWEFTWASGVAGVVDEYLIGVPGGYSRYPVLGGHFGMIVPQIAPSYVEFWANPQASVTLSWLDGGPAFQHP